MKSNNENKSIFKQLSVENGGLIASGRSKVEKNKILISNRKSFSRASGSKNILNAEPENLNKILNPFKEDPKKLKFQSLRGIPEQSYCLFGEICIENWAKIPDIILNRINVSKIRNAKIRNAKIK
jgi:hypothetical protein